MEERMLSDEELVALIKKNSGGGGGTGDYTQLSNLPQINSVELTGNKSLSDLGIASEESLAAILDAIAEEFDATATYAVGDYTIEEGVLYRCTAPHTGAWDANDFTETTVSDEILSALSAISGILDGTDIDSFADVETALADKADKADVKNEFIGTTAQWNALTVEQRKAYDKYQITDDFISGGGGGGGVEVKTMTRTGTGTNSYTLDFGDETPIEIISMFPKAGEPLLLSNYEGTLNFAWGNLLGIAAWSTQSSGVPTTNNGGFNIVRMSYSGNTVTFNGSADQISNHSEQVYEIKYLV